MLLFSTTLAIGKHVTKRDFIDLVIEWNNDNLRATNRVPGVSRVDSSEARFGTDNLWLAVKDHPEKDILAVRHEKVTADGAIWDTDYVLDLAERTVSIRLDRSYVEEALRVDAQFSAPHFITLLIEAGFLENDSCLPIRREPTHVGPELEDVLLAIASGKNEFRLPVVYVSKKEDGKHPVDVGLLASKLKGIAHVFVRQGAPLALECGRRLERGDIAIYFPSPQADDVLIPCHDADDDENVASQQMLDSVLRLVVQYSNTLQVGALQTWQGVSNDLLLCKMKSLSEKAHKAELSERETTALLDSFDEDYSNLKKDVADLAGRIAALEAENVSLRSKLDTSRMPLLHAGEETDVYPGEIKDLLLDTLDKASRSCKSGRRQDVLLDIVRSNDFQQLTKGRTEQMCALHKNADPTSERFVSGMEKLGFKITTGKKHNKAKYNGEERYAVTYAKTPSDFRSAKNSASVFIDMAY